LIAYNVNLNTTSVKRANSIAFDVREAGRVKLDDKGKKVLDALGAEVRIPGKLKGVKAIGWFIEEYGVAQVSINITKFKESPLHMVFEECNMSAYERGLRVTGSELIGLVPLSAMLDAGRYFLNKQKLSSGVSDEALIHIAIKSMGLDELAPFDPKQRIIEYQLNEPGQKKLVDMTLHAFANETASESPAPGGGSIAAYLGTLGVSLGTMVANLSASKKGWEDRWKEFSDLAETGQQLKSELLHLVDEDTAAFNGIMSAFQLPKSTDEEKKARKQAIQDATKYAIEIPFKVMEKSFETMTLLKEMAVKGNPNSVSDAGVGALCALAAVLGAGLNVKINAAGYDDKEYVTKKLSEVAALEKEALAKEHEIIEIVNKVIAG
jgi:glutamate formiminotransferase/formiminotetrahydrofolate cyclodeaminase